MKRIDKTVIRETRYIALCVLLLSVLMQAVFLIVGYLGVDYGAYYTVLLGNLLGAAVTVLNFFLMGLSVQSALGKDEKEAKNAIKASQRYRFLLLFVVLVVGVLLPCFNTLAVVIPLLLFSRIAIAFRPLLDKKREKTQGGMPNE